MLKQNFCLIVFLVAQIREILCGTLRNESLFQPRIIGGIDAYTNSAPFQVSIRSKANVEKRPCFSIGCGGSLISDNVVLTAAHCVFREINGRKVDDPSLWVVVMGNLDCSERNENTLQFKIKKIVEGEVVAGFHSDIALLFLDGTVPKNHPTVKPIILNSAPIKDGYACRAYGWGDQKKAGALKVLQTATLPALTYETCLKETNYGDVLKKHMFCAGYLEGGPGACDGDSGGPLVCGGLQAGIISWGNECGKPKNPNVVTNVARFREWITVQTIMNGGSTAKFAPLRV